MTDSRPPAGLEHKAAPALLEPPPTLRVASPPEPGSGITAVDERTGVVEAIVAVTGIRDDVNDVIEPGAFRRTLRERTPRMVLGHDWNRVVGRTVSAVELPPGDPRLPRTAPDGTPWPRQAGALWVKAAFILGTKDGREAYEVAKAFGARSRSPSAIGSRRAAPPLAAASGTSATWTSNESVRIKKLGKVFLLIGPVGEDPVDTFNLAMRGPGAACCAVDLERFVDTDVVRDGTRMRQVVPLLYFTEENDNVGDEELAYSHPLPVAEFPPGVQLSVRFYVYGCRRSGTTYHRKVQDFLPIPGEPAAAPPGSTQPPGVGEAAAGCTRESATCSRSARRCPKKQRARQGTAADRPADRFAIERGHVP
jgi:hypothetical protein